jgi:hypothetical protein
MKANNEKVADIARAVGVSRPTIYAVLASSAATQPSGYEADHAPI